MHLALFLKQGKGAYFSDRELDSKENLAKCRIVPWGMPMKLTKKDKAYEQVQRNSELLSCPICSMVLRGLHGTSVHCTQNHQFDFARSGYLNLLVGHQRYQYGRELFAARRKVFAAGVYDPLIAQISSVLGGSPVPKPIILDAGCGEGSLVARLSQRLPKANFVGIDISRDGIQMAAAQPDEILWLVADLAQLPLQTASVDFILNVLSPANYREFQRVLRPGGLILKVLPGSDYLQEIRERLGGTQAYSNEGVLATLVQNMEVREKTKVYYKATVDAELWPSLVAMTPLTQYREVVGESPSSLTIDLELIWGVISSAGSK